MPKIETPEEFASKLSDRQHTSPYIASLVVLRDAAIRSESAELLRVCGEALDSVDSWWRLPNRDRTIENIEPAILKTVDALAALKGAGVME